MRSIAVLLVATLMCSAAAAQTANPPAVPAASPDADPQATADPNLPLSTRRVREALERASGPGALSTNAEDKPTFRLEIRERMKSEDLLKSLDFRSGPIPWGGVYLYEQQRIVSPATSYPLAQPWAAFNQTELLIVAAQSVLTGLAFNYAKKNLAKAQRNREERAAREDVARDIEAYCASRENGGAGIVICDRAKAAAR